MAHDILYCGHYLFNTYDAVCTGNALHERKGKRCKPYRVKTNRCGNKGILWKQTFHISPIYYILWCCSAKRNNHMDHSVCIRILSLIHISEPTRLGMISYAVFCLKKKNKHKLETEVQPSLIQTKDSRKNRHAYQ